MARSRSAIRADPLPIQRLINGGTFSAGLDESVGFTNAATYTQTGGTHDVNRELYIAPTAGGGGTFVISNGALLSAQDVFVGGTFGASSGAVGKLTVNAGGAVTISDTIKVWSDVSRLSLAAGGTISAGRLDLGGNPRALLLARWHAQHHRRYFQ